MVINGHTQTTTTGSDGTWTVTFPTTEVPAGEYEIHTWRLDEPGPYGEVELRPRKDFSCRFNVRSGTAIYLGRLRLELGDGDTQKLVVEDRRDSDLNGFKRKYPVLANSPTAMSICNIR